MTMEEAKQGLEFRLGHMELELPDVGVGGRPSSLLAERVGLPGTQSWNHLCSHFPPLSLAGRLNILILFSAGRLNS